MNETLQTILAMVIAIILGGVVTPIILNWLFNKMGWFK